MAMDFSRKPQGFNTVTKKREYEQLAGALLDKAELVCAYLFPDGRKINGEWRIGSVYGERGKSMGINLRTGVGKDFDAQDGAGDLLALWSLKRGVKMHEAYDEAAEWLGWERRDTGPKPSWAVPSRPALPATPAPQRQDDDDLWWRSAKSTHRWDYFDENGELWVTVCRFERPGEKVIRPWDHKRSDWKWPEGRRPLFNLEGIKRSTGPVLLVEGEKCADRLTALGYTATTMPGGANAANVVDWTPLRGRDVIRWADNDHPRADGKPAACAKWIETTRECLSAVGVRAVRDVAIAGQAKPDGWDCADATDQEIGDLIKAAGSSPVQRSITANKLELPTFASIPKRRFVYGYAYQRGTVTVTAGEGGSGKSALHVVEAICIATGRDLLETGKPIERCKVWMIALEDDETEMHRRIAAAMMHFNIDRRELEGWLFVTTRSDAPDFMLAISDRNGTQVSASNVEDMKAAIRDADIGAVTIDPYVYIHLTNENDNSAQAAVMSALVSVATETKVAVALVHHAKKPSANDRGGPSAGDIRGAGAIVNSARHGRLVNTMSAVEADKLGVPEDERFFHFRASSVKANYSPPGDRSGDWYKMHGVRLPNGRQDEEGDGVGVVTRWKAPDPFKAAGVTVDILRQVQNEVERSFATGNPYFLSTKVKNYPKLGDCIAELASIDTTEKKEQLKVAGFAREWLKSGALIEQMWHDPIERKPRKIIRRGNIA